ncbi:hypothetical protein D3C77_527590 [compost metagenome]
MQVLQRLRRATFTAYGARNNVNQVDVVIYLSDGRATDNTVHHIGHVLGRQAKLTCLVLGDIDSQYFAWLVPVVNDLANVVIAVEQRRQGDGVFTHFIDVLAHYSVLDWQPDRRTHFQ